MSARKCCDQCGCVTAHRDYRPERWLSVESCWDDEGGDFCSWSCLVEWSTGRLIDAENDPVPDDRDDAPRVNVRPPESAPTTVDPRWAR